MLGDEHALNAAKHDMATTISTRLANIDCFAIGLPPHLGGQGGIRTLTLILLLVTVVTY
ncbi:hypothetical protein SPHINGOAX6_70561 [Sphingomonas sp. AX6]|nr:hypothetical protein SPHINGOAX6_70561 [Sphingomonas sp. AX6]